MKTPFLLLIVFTITAPAISQDQNDEQLVKDAANHGLIVLINIIPMIIPAIQQKIVLA